MKRQQTRWEFRKFVLVNMKVCHQNIKTDSLSPLNPYVSHHAADGAISRPTRLLRIFKLFLYVQVSQAFLDEAFVSGSSLRRLSGLQHRRWSSTRPALPHPTPPQLPLRNRRGPDHLPLRQLHLPDRESPAHHQRLAGQAVTAGVRLIYTAG